MPNISHQCSQSISIVFYVCIFHKTSARALRVRSTLRVVGVTLQSLNTHFSIIGYIVVNMVVYSNQILVFYSLNFRL